jgi:hypothetical protein
VDRLRRVTDALGARLVVRILWQGEELDRLLDAVHARLVESVMQRLDAAGWIAVPEATFRSGPERGSIDILAWHQEAGQLLVLEVKSVMPDVQGTLAGIDRKARLAPSIARDRGWATTSVSRVLILPDDRTARRRLAQVRATFDRALPARTVTVRRWLRSPDGPLAGVMFLPDVLHEQARHRVRADRGRPALGRPAGP